MTKGQLAPINTNQMESYFNEKEMQVVVNSIAKGATNEELALFVQICKHNGLDPFKNHICFIKYGNQMSIQVAVEGILYLAQQREDYKGVTSQLVHENDEFEVDIDSETQELKITKHSIKIPRGKVVASYAIAKREGYPDKVVLIETDEVEHLKKKSGSQWNNYYNDMFKKHALKRALKLQFGIDVDDEQVQQESFDSYESRQRIDITPESNAVEVGEGKTIDPEQEIKAKWDEIHQKLEQYSITKSELTEIIKTNYNKKPNDLSLQQVIGLSKIIDFKGQEKTKQPNEDNFEDAFNDFEQTELV